MNHAIRITLPYEDCRAIVEKWAERSQSCIAYQHDADEEVSKTHVHLSLYGCEVKAEALKRMWVDAPGKGNEFWSFKDSYEKDKVKVPVDLEYIRYMSKGKLRPVWVKNISEDIVEGFRQSWVEQVKADRPGEASEKIIRKIVDYFDIKKNIGYYRNDDEMDFGQPEYNMELLLSNVRTKTFKVLWGEKRMAPHASHFKIIASTAFLRICEDARCFDQGVAAIQKLWY